MEKEYKIAVYHPKAERGKEFLGLFDRVMHKNYISDYKIQIYHKIEDLQYDTDKVCCRYDIYFLKISDTSRETMEYAEWLREQGIQESLVYLTDNIEIFSNGYKVKILDYLFEPVQFKAIEKIILYDYENHYCQNILWLKKNSVIFRLKMNTIVCAEVKGRGIKIYVSEDLDLQRAAKEEALKADINLSEKSLKISEKLTDFKCRLSPSLFIQCHQSFIINLSKIVSLKRYYAVADNGSKNGKRVDVSKKYWKETVQRFKEHIHEGAGDNILTDSELEMVAGGKQLGQLDFTMFHPDKKEE